MTSTDSNGTTAPATPVTTSSTQLQSPRRGLRWWPAPLVLLLGIVAQQGCWWFFEPDRTIQVFATMGALSGTALGLILWWLFWSRLRWRTRIAGLVAVPALVALTLWATVRLEGFTGEMIPRLAWRWNKSAEERADEFRSALKVPSADRVPQAAKPADVPLVVTATDWPQYRGPRQDGIVRNGAIRRDWDAHPSELIWKHPIGLGWSSFAIVDGLAFTQEQRRDQESVVCYDAATGQEFWTHSDPVRFVHPVAGDGPRATPTVHEGLIYSLGATGILNCLAARTGEKRWSHDILTENKAKNTEWGTSASPLVFENLVVVNPGGPNGRAVVAYDRVSGEEAWSAGSDKASYAAPELVEIDGIRQILIFDAVGLAGHAADGGKELWKFPWTNNPEVNAAQPIQLAANTFFIGNGYAIGSTAIQISHSQSEWDVTPLWATKKLKLKFNCAVERDGYIYGLDEGILACFDAASGKQSWKGGRFGYGEFLLIDDLLLVQAESGDVVLVEASPKAFKEVARFHALEGKCWNHPAFSRGRLFVRNADEAACYDISAPESRADAGEKQ